MRQRQPSGSSTNITARCTSRTSTTANPAAPGIRPQQRNPGSGGINDTGDKNRTMDLLKILSEIAEASGGEYKEWDSGVPGSDIKERNLSFSTPGMTVRKKILCSPTTLGYVRPEGLELQSDFTRAQILVRLGYAGTSWLRGNSERIESLFGRW